MLSSLITYSLQEILVQRQWHRRRNKVVVEHYTGILWTESAKVRNNGAKHDTLQSEPLACFARSWRLATCSFRQTQRSSIQSAVFTYQAMASPHETTNTEGSDAHAHEGCLLGNASPCYVSFRNPIFSEKPRICITEYTSRNNDSLRKIRTLQYERFRGINQSVVQITTY